MTAARPSSSGPAPHRRVDAQRSIDAILEAARTVLGERPDASMEEIAAAAGVTRQTVYAHFPSRDALIVGLLQSVRDEGRAALESAGLDDLPPVAAMREFLRISWQLIERSAVLLEPLLNRMSGLKSKQSRGEVDAIIERIVRRGQESGDFDTTLPPEWLVAVTHSLAHVAAERVITGKQSKASVAALLESTVVALYGIDPSLWTPIS